MLIENGSGSRVISTADLRFLRVMLGLQVILGLLWGVSMLFFARQIVHGAAEGPHIEKIAMEGAAHMTSSSGVCWSGARPIAPGMCSW